MLDAVASKTRDMLLLFRLGTKSLLALVLFLYPQLTLSGLCLGAQGLNSQPVPAKGLDLQTLGAVIP